MRPAPTPRPIPGLTHDRYVEAIGEQTRALRDLLAGPDVDLRTAVPSCPGWNLAQLTTHVGEELRWLELLVRTRAAVMPDDTAMRDLDPEPVRDPAATGDWIVDGGEALMAAFAESGPDATIWTPIPSVGTAASFYARRFAHEQLMHRIDAVVALGAPIDGIPDDLARDGLAEWMELGALPEMLTFHPHRRELFGPGRTLLVSPTDAPDESWLVDLTGDVMVHQRAEPGASAAATLRGSLVDLLLVIYARWPSSAVEVVGDRALASTWLAAVEFA